MAIDPLLPYHVAADILECARLGLVPTAKGVPSRVCIVPAQADDDCCAGQLTVAIERLFGSTVFPNEDLGLTPCGPALTAMDLTIMVLRCAPSFDIASNTAPTCVQLDEAARIQHEDAYAIRRSVACCLVDMQQEIASVMGQTSLFERGGCMGSSLAITIGFGDGCICS